MKKKKKIIKRIYKKKKCNLCKNNVDNIDYKDVKLLQKFISDKGKILPSRSTGNCTKHQRIVAGAIKRARIACLLPFSK